MAIHTAFLVSIYSGTNIDSVMSGLDIPSTAKMEKGKLNVGNRMKEKAQNIYCVQENCVLLVSLFTLRGVSTSKMGSATLDIFSFTSLNFGTSKFIT